MYIGKVVSLKIYPEKGSPGISAERIQFEAGQGIRGDHFSGKSGRQISLLDLETRKWMDAQTVTGPCFYRFRENILFDGIPFEELAEGRRFRVGTGILVITQCGKRCFSECARLQAGIPCRLKEAVLYARVDTPGAAAIQSDMVPLSVESL